MSISEIIAKATSRHDRDGVVDRDAAIAEALPQVMSDPIAVESIVRQDLARRIKQHLCRVRDDAIATFGNGQGDLFGLRPAHALAGDDGIIKSTRALSRIEFAGLIKMRERQVEDDMSYLARLRFAADETALIWDRHPNWSWGQVEDAYRRLKKAA